MGHKHLSAVATSRKTPQTEPIPGREKDMARNWAGGYTFKADSWERLERFLILGTEKSTYYVGAKELTKENVENLRGCIAADGKRAVEKIVEISLAGRAPKNDPAIYALALAASCPDASVRQAALDSLPRVCRIGTHLFMFVEFIDKMRGWGPQLRKGVAAWYLDKNRDALAYQIAKYGQRGGFTHADVLRLCHPEGANDSLFRWVLGRPTEQREVLRLSVHQKTKRVERRDTYPASQMELPAIILGMELVKYAESKEGIIRSFGLTREMLPTECLKSPKVWEALLEKMPMTAMIRTLGRMGAVGLLTTFSNAEKLVIDRLGDEHLLRKSRVHPIQVLAALLTYGSGKGVKGKLTWTPEPRVVDALSNAFYAAFANVEPTGKRFYLGVDVSGSMSAGAVAGIDGLTPCMGATAMSMLIARTEPNYFIGGFSHQFRELGISASDRLSDAMTKAIDRNFGGTDVAIPIKHALDRKVEVDCFVVITDGQTWAGDIHASQAIQQYRDKTGVDAKLVVMNLLPHPIRLTDPEDAGSLDVIGFDASVPVIINQFLGVQPAGATLEDAAD